MTGRLIALACALLCLAPAGAAAADPGRWTDVGRQTIPLVYFQGITSEPGGDLFFDGVNVGLYRTNSVLGEEFANANVIPAAVGAAPPAGEGYNHLGDISYDSGGGGRILLPLECYYPGTQPSANTCQTGSIGVTDLAGTWQYYVRLDTADIQKAMWVEADDSGDVFYTQGGNGSGGASRTLLVYDSADLNVGEAATPGVPGSPAPIEPIREITSALPPAANGTGVSQMTGATFFRGRLYVARSLNGGAGSPTDTFQVYSLDPSLATDQEVRDSLRLEIERQIAGESEGLDVNRSFGSVLEWQIQPIPSQLGVQAPTYGVGSLLSFNPAAADVKDTDDDGTVDVDENPACINQPGTGPAGCEAATADPGDEDQDEVFTPADNCPNVANNFQANADQDPQGDACDADDDNDAAPDTTDNCHYTPNPDQLDTDGDGKGNVCDDDDDNDGVNDWNDNCGVTPNPDQADADGDFIGDACDDAPPATNDTTPPDTAIGKVKVKRNKATIAFASSEDAGSFNCRLDGKVVKGCRSPLKLKKLKPGKHRFEVAAVDVAGNVDPTPDKAKFKVKKPKKSKGKKG